MRQSGSCTASAFPLLVPDRHYQQVSGWINDHHLRSRLVYFRMVAGVKPAPRPSIDAGTMPLYCLADESRNRHRSTAGSRPSSFRRANYVCVDDMTEFRRERNAVTREGLIKSDKRHEKDDRRAIGDRRSYVLGWDNQQKIDALLDQMTRTAGPAEFPGGQATPDVDPNRCGHRPPGPADPTGRVPATTRRSTGRAWSTGSRAWSPSNGNFRGHRGNCSD